MTQSLVERLRDPRGFDWGDFCALTMEGAKRIEALEKEVKRWKDHQGELCVIEQALRIELAEKDKEIASLRLENKDV